MKYFFKSYFENRGGPLSNPCLDWLKSFLKMPGLDPGTLLSACTECAYKLFSGLDLVSISGAHFLFKNLSDGSKKVLMLFSVVGMSKEVTKFPLTQGHDLFRTGFSDIIRMYNIHIIYIENIKHFQVNLKT